MIWFAIKELIKFILLFALFYFFSDLTAQNYGQTIGLIFNIVAGVTFGSAYANGLFQRIEDYNLLKSGK